MSLHCFTHFCSHSLICLSLWPDPALSLSPLSISSSSSAFLSYHILLTTSSPLPTEWPLTRLLSTFSKLLTYTRKFCGSVHKVNFLDCLYVFRSCQAVAGTRRRNTALLQMWWPSLAGSTRWDTLCTLHFSTTSSLTQKESRERENSFSCSVKDLWALAIKEWRDYNFSFHCVLFCHPPSTKSSP